MTSLKSLFPYVQNNSILNSGFLGFEDLFNSISSFADDTDGSYRYPPCNIKVIKEGEKYELEITVAGFKKEEINITHNRQDEKMIIKGTHTKKKSDNDSDYSHRGLSKRNFTREYKLGRFMEIKNAEIVDGILYVLLEKDIPEEQKPKVINIK